jgi:hypothetical protein
LPLAAERAVQGENMLTRMLLGVSLPVMLAGAGSDGPEFAPKGSGFMVSFPGMPTEHKQNVKTPSGFIDVTVYVYEPKKGEGQYVVSFSEYPEAVLKAGTDAKRLENARDGAVQSVKGTLKSEKKITLGASPGLDLVIEAKDKTAIRTRVYAVKNRLYQTMVVGPAKMVAARETEQFLNSFRLTN